MDFYMRANNICLRYLPKLPCEIILVEKGIRGLGLCLKISKQAFEELNPSLWVVASLDSEARLLQDNDKLTATTTPLTAPRCIPWEQGCCCYNKLSAAEPGVSGVLRIRQPIWIFIQYYASALMLELHTCYKGHNAALSKNTFPVRVTPVIFFFYLVKWLNLHFYLALAHRAINECCFATPLKRTKCADAVLVVSPEPCPSHTNTWRATARTPAPALSDRCSADLSRMLPSTSLSPSNSFGCSQQRAKRFICSHFQTRGNWQSCGVSAISLNKHKSWGHNSCQLFVEAPFTLLLCTLFIRTCEIVVNGGESILRLALGVFFLSCCQVGEKMFQLSAFSAHVLSARGICLWFIWFNNPHFLLRYANDLHGCFSHVPNVERRSRRALWTLQNTRHVLLFRLRGWASQCKYFIRKGSEEALRKSHVLKNFSINII